MAKKSKKNKLGAWAFLIGVILAIILGIFLTPGTVASVIAGILIIIGIIVGLFNVGSEESSKFMLAGAVLVIVSSLGSVALAAGLGSIPLGGILAGVLNALVLLFVPTTIIVALKSIFELAKD